MITGPVIWPHPPKYKRTHKGCRRQARFGEAEVEELVEGWTEEVDHHAIDVTRRDENLA
jgi:hypothetical protein